ncbi:predicted protein [Nematostella vectensis]|uniref:G-protein coupled receptors family 1 profile domain-containing protein n=1 Tax=Nematostella vectensis TaxID=45351 RepID=A7S1V7_NEMVE|nr:predicted protein [Nematostella vectensis]|eukprot:XP_001634331.1 predicted protein [Nematostella vectensis]
MNSSIKCAGFVQTYFDLEYESTSWVTRSCYITATINTVSAVPATFLNLLVIAAIIRSSTLRTPSFLLICSMAVSDFLVGLLFQPRFTVLRVAEIEGNFDLYCSAANLSSFGNVMVLASVMMAAMISVDRYLALHLQMGYQTVVTKSRVLKMLFLLWTLAIVLGAVMPLISIAAANNVLVFLTWPALLLAVISYLKCCHTLRRFYRQQEKQDDHEVRNKGCVPGRITPLIRFISGSKSNPSNHIALGNRIVSDIQIAPRDQDPTSDNHVLQWKDVTRFQKFNIIQDPNNQDYINDVCIGNPTDPSRPHIDTPTLPAYTFTSHSNAMKSNTNTTTPHIDTTTLPADTFTSHSNAMKSNTNTTKTHTDTLISNSDSAISLECITLHLNITTHPMDATTPDIVTHNDPHTPHSDFTTDRTDTNSPYITTIPNTDFATPHTVSTTTQTAPNTPNSESNLSDASPTSLHVSPTTTYLGPTSSNTFPNFYRTSSTTSSNLTITNHKRPGSSRRRKSIRVEYAPLNFESDRRSNPDRSQVVPNSNKSTEDIRDSQKVNPDTNLNMTEDSGVSQRVNPDTKQSKGGSRVSHKKLYLKYEKVFNTMSIIVALLFACYTFYFIITPILYYQVGFNGKVKFISDLGMLLVLLNSTLNPIIYIMRMRELRRSCFSLLRLYT